MRVLRPLRGYFAVTGSGRTDFRLSTGLSGREFSVSDCVRPVAPNDLIVIVVVRLRKILIDDILICLLDKALWKNPRHGTQLMPTNPLNHPPATWQQHYPTYHASAEARDILLAEYESTAKAIQADEQLFSRTSNLVLIVIPAVASVAIGALDSFRQSVLSIVNVNVSLIACAIIVVLYSILALSNLASTQKTIAYAQRKVVVIRRMLGLDYGRLQLVLPDHRVEGASDSFSIPIFRGWISSHSHPYWTVSIFSTVLLLFISSYWVSQIEFTQTEACIVYGYGTIFWLLILGYSYRSNLLDTNETMFLLAIKSVANLLNLRLVNNFEYIIYRSKLAWFETDRLKVDTTNLEKFLIALEDRDFMNHRGVSLRGLVRALLGYLRIRRRAGGSTITQQLVRSLFIVDYKKTYRRKIIEVLLALWFDSKVSKDHILKMYISSVRYADSVFGITEAMKNFFGQIKTQYANAESFYLIERISNSRDYLLVKKVDQNIYGLKGLGLLDDDDEKALREIYREQVENGKIKLRETEKENYKNFLGK